MQEAFWWEKWKGGCVAGVKKSGWNSSWEEAESAVGEQFAMSPKRGQKTGQEALLKLL